MAFSDPQSIVIGSDTFALPRVFAKEGGKFKSNDGACVMEARTVENTKTYLHQVRLTKSKITPDPFRPAENRKIDASMTINFFTPPTGYTVQEMVDMYTGLNTLLAAGTYANLKKLVGGES